MTDTEEREISSHERQQLNGMEELVKKLEDFVNPFNFPVEAFAKRITQQTHRTLQQNIMRCFLATIQMWAKNYDTKMFDLRNEDTCRIANKMVKGAEDDLFLRMV